MAGSTPSEDADGKELTLKQERFIAALLAHPTIVAAAAAANVPETTARHWLAKPHVRKAYREARRHAVEHSLTMLQRIMGEAVEALQRNLNAGQANVEVAAAKAIIEYSIRAVETVDLAERIESIEAALAEQGGHR